ncbi:hypothetical protein ACFVT1_06820 [Streptomyces sp. NPDC057963]|uniref:hypothetical protein n=1 Tax=Streptomyces sp. NPDC057963 TaxID=3346290 RepID=UPI0036E0872C
MTANASAALRRTAAVASPELITVTLAGSVAGSATTVSAAKAAEVRAHTRADLVVTGEELRVRPVRGASLSAPVAVSVQWPLVGGAAGVCTVVAVGAALLPRAVRCRSTPVN